MPVVGLADDVPKNPQWCQKGYVCVPVDYLAERTARIYELRADNERLKARVGQLWWASVGAEYLPNSDEWKPYGIGGIRLGRVSGWAGFFGDVPAAGIGWNW